MYDRLLLFKLPLFAIAAIVFGSAAGQGAYGQSLRGTLVVTVPTREGLVICSDKRLYNQSTGSFRDDAVKIRKVNNITVFVATNTIGFFDSTTGKMGFDAFETTEGYLSKNEFKDNRIFWDGLKNVIKTRLLEHLAKQKYEAWPPTDLVNNKLLFNLVFYAVNGNSARSYSLKVFYEKSRIPIIFIPDVVSEEVRTPKLSGKGNDVMAHLANNAGLRTDPFILKFDQSKFDIKTTSIGDAVNFAKRLFLFANTAVPHAQVSATYDCALLNYRNGFQWLK